MSHCPQFRVQPIGTASTSDSLPFGMEWTATLSAAIRELLCRRLEVLPAGSYSK